MMRLLFPFLCLGLAASLAFSDDVSLAAPSVPADSAERAQKDPVDLPPHSAMASGLRENRAVGDYGEPAWVSRRLFSELRTYVIPKGRFEFEYWLFLAQPSRKSSDDADKAGLATPKNEVKQVYEAEMGLGHRLQLDLYQVYVKDGSDGQNALDATKFELRYAFADWGVLWGNPTLYAEWEQAAEGDDALEGKLLLCGAFTPPLRWAANFVWEEKTGGTRERSLEANAAAGYAAVDERVTIGVEANFADVSELRSPGSAGRTHAFEAAAGPSLRIAPGPHAQIILSEFVGITEDASVSKSVAIIGWEF